MKHKLPSLSDVSILLLVAGCGTLIHILLNGKYGFHRDELDIIMNARQLAWGYVAYPPITPFLARVELTLFGPSLIGMRLLPALAQGAVIFMAGWMARDMGGRRSAQVVAAIAAGIAPVALISGTMIQYMSFDYLWWVVIAFFFVRLLATENPRYWLGIGAAIGLGVMTKFTVVFWVVGLIVAAFLSPRRKDVLSKWLWLGALIAILMYLPNLIWQIQHDFISLDFLKYIHARDLQIGRGNDFLQAQFYASTNPFALPLWLSGLLSCLLAKSMRRFRPLAWMFLTTFIIFMVSKGRFYYVAPGYVMLLAAGSAWIEGFLAAREGRLRKIVTVAIYSLITLGAVGGILMGKPVAPVNSPLWKIIVKINPEFAEMVGWQDLTAQVAAVYQSIPDADKPFTAILAGNYGEAGALDLFGREYSLPPIISGADSFWYRGYGDPPPQTVILVGFERGYADQLFKSCTRSGTVSNQYRVINEESLHHTGLYICTSPRKPWSEMWLHMQWFQ